MSVSILIDMNLSPLWVDDLTANGLAAVHWSTVGDPRATDRSIMDWAIQNQHIVFTHDLDFGAALALTHATGPSVLQLRGPDVLPERVAKVVVAAIQQHEAELATGALHHRCWPKACPHPSAVTSAKADPTCMNIPSLTMP